MPKFLERDLRRQAAKKGFKGERADRYVYGAMNNLGAMHGSHETAKGREMERKHEADMKQPPYHHTHIEHHHDGSHTVQHHPHMKASKSAAFMSVAEPKSYSVSDGHGLLEKLNDHLGLKSHGDGTHEPEAGAEGVEE